MRRATIYLFVALLTFAVGIAASAVFNLGAPLVKKSETRRVTVSEQTELVKKIETSRTELNSCGCRQESGVGEPSTMSPASNSARDPIHGGVLNGKALNLPLPAYPPIARAARASGTVTVMVVIDEKGCVISAKAVSGHPLLQRAAVEAARNACFSPTRLSGQPVKVTGVITYNFVTQ